MDIFQTILGNVKVHWEGKIADGEYYSELKDFQRKLEYSLSGDPSFCWSVLFKFLPYIGQWTNSLCYSKE